MASKPTPHDIERLRREAKKISKTEGILYSHALDGLAHGLGYQNWSLVPGDVAAEAHRYPRFSRSVEDMQALFRKDRALNGFSSTENAKRDLMPNLSREYANPISALQYARDYVETALAVPRFSVHALSVAFIEMRVLLPYAFEQVQDEDQERFIIVGRDYKPIGMPLKKWVDYEQYPNLHVYIPREKLHRVAYGLDHDRGYLYADGTNPRRSRKNAVSFLRQLDAVMDLVRTYER